MYDNSIPLSGKYATLPLSPNKAKTGSPHDAQPLLTIAIIVLPPTANFKLPCFLRSFSFFVNRDIFNPVNIAVKISKTNPTPVIDDHILKSSDVSIFNLYSRPKSPSTVAITKLLFIKNVTVIK